MTPEIISALGIVCFIIFVFIAGIYEIDQSFRERFVSRFILAILLISSLGLMLWALIWSSIETEKYTSVKNDEIIMEIEKKDTHSYIINECLYQNYYFYFDDDKIEVSSRIYNEYSEGDKVILNKETTYRYDPETNSTNIVNVSYDFVG